MKLSFKDLERIIRALKTEAADWRDKSDIYGSWEWHANKARDLAKRLETEPLVELAPVVLEEVE